MGKVKESGFKHLLEAGAASVVMESELSSSTHAFVDTSHLKSSANVRMITHNCNITVTREWLIVSQLLQYDFVIVLHDVT